MDEKINLKGATLNLKNENHNIKTCGAKMLLGRKLMASNALLEKT